MQPTTQGRRAIAVGATLASLALGVPGAEAATSQVTGKRTELRLATGAKHRLADAHVRVRATRPASMRGRSLIRFAVRGGRFDFASDRGRVTHRGAIRFARRGQAVKLKSFRVSFARRWTASARVGGKRITVLKLARRGAKARTTADGRTFTGVRAKVTRKGARTLNRRLRARAFRKGSRVGSLRVVVARGSAATPQPGGTAPGVAAPASTALSLAPGLQELLRRSGLEATALDPATRNADGTLTFPVGTYSFDRDSQQGTFDLQGGLRLGNGSTADVALDRPQLVLGTDAQGLYATVDGARVRLADVDLSGLVRVDVADGTVQLNGLQLRVNAAGLAVLAPVTGGGLVLGDLLGSLNLRLPAA